MKKKVLVIDDDHGILEVMKIILEDKGYQVSALSDKDNFQQEIGQNTPDIILLDIWMSGQDGLELTRLWKSQEETKNIPIILSSALSGAERDAIEAGADDFLAKPFDIRDLVRIVEKNLSK